MSSLLQPNRYPTPEMKVRYAISRMRYDKYNSTYLTPESPTPAWLSDWRLFEDFLASASGLGNAEATAENRLLKLKQKGPASRYIADFNELTATLKMTEDDRALRILFKAGLSESLKIQVLRSKSRAEQDAMPFEDFKQYVQELDNRLYQARIMNEPKGNRQQRNTPNTSADPYRMDVDALNARINPSPPLGPRSGSLSRWMGATEGRRSLLQLRRVRSLYWRLWTAKGLRPSQGGNGTIDSLCGL